MSAKQVSKQYTVESLSVWGHSEDSTAQPQAAAIVYSTAKTNQIAPAALQLSSLQSK